MDFEDVCKRIKEIRIQKGLSQKSLGELCGLPQQAINRIEQGNRKIDIELLEKLSHALGVSPDSIIGWDKKKSTIDNFVENPYYIDLEGNLAKFPGVKKSTQTIAAHFEGESFTAEELEQIRLYAEFLKSKRKATDQ